MFFRLFKKKDRTPDPMKYLIVGLGNMGAEYEGTRHNIGFEVADHLAEKGGATWSQKKLGDLTSVKFRGRTLLLLKPSTYMNRSGKAIRYWLEKENIKAQNLFVIVDDKNLDFGRLRIRSKGSDGGHNGLKDIQDHIGTNYTRLRIGIGDDFGRGGQVDFVLGKWSEEERLKLKSIISTAAEAAESFTYIGTERTMSQFNN
jgi:PTH1 family peptidyl-tRNA hydrolase